MFIIFDKRSKKLIKIVTATHIKIHVRMFGKKFLVIVTYSIDKSFDKVGKKIQNIKEI